MAFEGSARKLGSFGISLLVHVGILIFIATMTFTMTMPEGNVSDGRIDFAVAPKGSQLDTMNVSKKAQAEVPEKIKMQPAPPPPPPPSNPAPKDEGTKAEVEPEPIGTMPVETPESKSQKDLPDKAPSPEPVPVLPMKAVEDAPETQQTPAEPVPTPVPVVGNQNANAAPTAAGNDQVNLQGQEKTSDQTYGRADGVKDALSLTPMPGNRKPEYPFMARFRHIEGTVVVRFDVDAAGKVSNIRLEKSENEMFNANVMSAVRTWHYHPPVTPGEYFHQFNFKLTGEAQESKARLRTK